MTTPISVSDTDLHIMMSIVKAPDPGEDGPALPRSTLPELRSLIPCQAVGFIGQDTPERTQYFGQGTLGDDPSTPWEPAFLTHYWDSVCAYPDRSGDLSSVIKITDFYSLREYRKTPIYTELFGPDGKEHEMMMCLPAGPGRTLRLIFFRGIGEPDFTERDRALLILLRPHLHAAHLDVMRRQRGIPKLTKRQWELLGLVRAGYSNTQIARRLYISPHTVRKHLENIFERLNVTSRTAALAIVFPEPTQTIDG